MSSPSRYLNTACPQPFPSTASYNTQGLTPLAGIPQAPRSMGPRPSFNAKGYRHSGDYVFFWGSFLSNWDQSCKFKGATAMDYLLPRLSKNRISHPPLDSNPGELIRSHIFNCGEQFMMACKAFLFETDESSPILKAILASQRPADQKKLGRSVPNYDDQQWTEASKHVVVASQLARAEVNPDLSNIYMTSEQKTIFVEGSLSDRIWGVGVHWKNAAIENPRNWKGQNRLGMCHGSAAEEWRQIQEEKERTQRERSQEEQLEKDWIEQESAKEEQLEEDRIQREGAQEDQLEKEPIQKQGVKEEPPNKKRSRTSSTPEGRAGRSERWKIRDRKQRNGSQLEGQLMCHDEVGEIQENGNEMSEQR